MSAAGSLLPPGFEALVGPEALPHQLLVALTCWVTAAVTFNPVALPERLFCDMVTFVVAITL